MFHGSLLEAMLGFSGSSSKWFFKFLYLSFGPLSPPNDLGLDFGIKFFEHFPFGPP
jgi:hypothetical protein